MPVSHFSAIFQLYSYSLAVPRQSNSLLFALTKYLHIRCSHVASSPRTEEDYLLFMICYASLSFTRLNVCMQNPGEKSRATGELEPHTTRRYVIQKLFDRTFYPAGDEHTSAIRAPSSHAKKDLFKIGHVNISRSPFHPPIYT